MLKSKRFICHPAALSAWIFSGSPVFTPLATLARVRGALRHVGRGRPGWGWPLQKARQPDMGRGLAYPRVTQLADADVAGVSGVDAGTMAKKRRSAPRGGFSGKA